MTRRIWQTCASQIFDWHGLLIVLIFAGGTGVLERRTGIASVEEMHRFDGGNPSFDWGKWCI